MTHPLQENQVRRPFEHYASVSFDIQQVHDDWPGQIHVLCIRWEAGMYDVE